MMRLLTTENYKRLPKLYANEDKGLDALAQIKFVIPQGYWIWYASEFDGEDLFFGLVVGAEIELGYFSLSELVNLDSDGVQVRRDDTFKPTPLRELLKFHKHSQLA